jgi:thiol-disulfide isomerase/thioredoxin
MFALLIFQLFISSCLLVNGQEVRGNKTAASNATFSTNGIATALVFVTPECPISNKYVPEIKRLESQFRQQGVEFILVYSDPSITEEAIEKHLSEYSLSVRHVRDADQTLAKACGARMTPEVVVFGKGKTLLYRGRIDDRFRNLGRQTEPHHHDLRDVLEAVTSGKPAAFRETETVGCYIPNLAK